MVYIHVLRMITKEKAFMIQRRGAWSMKAAILWTNLIEPKLLRARWGFTEGFDNFLKVRWGFSDGSNATQNEPSKCFFLKFQKLTVFMLHAPLRCIINTFSFLLMCRTCMYHIYTSLPSQFIINPHRTFSQPSTISTEKFAHDSNVL